MIKVRPWQLMLVRLVVIPTLEKLALALEERAKKTPEEWDDVAAGFLRSAIEVLKDPTTIVET